MGDVEPDGPAGTPAPSSPLWTFIPGTWLVLLPVAGHFELIDPVGHRVAAGLADLDSLVP